MKVSGNNSELYRFHLRKNHNLDKHIEETISETFDGTYFPKREENFLLKSVRDLVDLQVRPKRAIERSDDIQ